MVQTVNSNDLAFATDKECRNRRRLLIAFGVITPNKTGIISKKRASPVMSTEKNSKNLREDLIRRGIISPVDPKEGGSFIDLPPHRPHICSKDEGEYNPKPVKNDEDYRRRRDTYFRIIQEILHSRDKLKLILGEKRDTDPDWYF